MKLAVIGLGKMGSTLVRGILDTGFLPEEKMTGSDIVVEECEHNANYGGIATVNNNRKAAAAAEVVLLAVKPQIIDEILDEINPVMEGKLLISIAAGITTEHLETNLPQSCRVIRVMPNTPALVREGISAVSCGENVGEEDLEFTCEMLSSVGEVITVKEELMDAITGLSGSGPAYGYLMIEALADGGVFCGLPREQAQKLAAQTLLGAARMVLATDNHPGELKDMVTSPGGTTITGMKVLEEKGLRGTLMEAVKAASDRSRQLGE